MQCSNETNRDSILEIVTIAIKETMNNHSLEISEESTLRDDIKMDSMDGINMIMDLEEVYSFGIKDEEFGKFHTVGSVVDFIQAELSKKNC